MPDNADSAVVKQVGSRLIISPSLPTQRVTRMVIQRPNADEYLLMFFEVRLPVIIGSDEEKARQIDSVEFVDEVCVGRFVFSKKRMVEIRDLLNEYVETNKLAAKDDEYPEP